MVPLTIHRFQWVALQINQLHKLSRERDIKNRLGKLPRTLEDAYHEIYTRIQSEEGSASEVARRAFQWIMCSEEPLSPAMLVAVVCQDPTTDKIDVVDIEFDFVLESCQNLLKLETAEGHEFCRFSHLSVQEYLETNLFSQLSSDVLVAQVCLTFLTDPIQSSIMLQLAGKSSGPSAIIDTDKTIGSTMSTEKVKEEGLHEVREYAKSFWLIHVQRSGEIECDFDSRLIMLLKRFLGSGAKTTPAFENWARSRKAVYLHSMHTPVLFDRLLDPPSQLAVQIAGFGLHRMFKDSWEHVDPNQKNARDKPLLAIAASAGCASTVQSLLDKGAQIDASSIKCSNALWYASHKGNESVVKVLLEYGADVNITGINRGRPLQAASECGHEPIARLLLAHGADVDARGSDCYTALHAASKNGHELIVGVLLAHGADVNAQGGIYHTVLQAASEIGHESIVGMLLTHGAHDQDGKALSAAASQGHESTVAVLLQASKIGVNDALFAACNSIHPVKSDEIVGTVMLLLDAGAVDPRGEALTGAARQGFTQVVALLLKEHSVGLDEALISACQQDINRIHPKTWEEAKAIVILLLKAGALDRRGHALEAATRNGFKEAANLLREAAERNGSRSSEDAESWSDESI